MDTGSPFSGGTFNFFTLKYLLKLTYSNGNSYKWKEKLIQYIYYQEALIKDLCFLVMFYSKINHVSKLNSKSTYFKLKLHQNNNQLSLFGSFKHVALPEFLKVGLCGKQYCEEQAQCILGCKIANIVETFLPVLSSICIG